MVSWDNETADYQEKLRGEKSKNQLDSSMGAQIDVVSLDTNDYVIQAFIKICLSSDHTESLPEHN